MEDDFGSSRVVDAETRASDKPLQHKTELRLWLRLLTCTTLIEAEVRRRLREEFDITLPRFDLLAQLERTPDGMTLGEVSRRMMVSNGNITGLVESLVKLRLISRIPNPLDRRAIVIKLTDKGRRTFSEMAAAHENWIAEILGELHPHDIKNMMESLSKIKHSASNPTPKE